MNPVLLVIDDNEMIRNFCQLVCAKSGYRLLRAASPIAGLKLLDEHPEVSLLLIDSLFVSPSTPEIIQSLAKRGETRHLKIIVLSAHGEPDRQWAARFSNVVDEITKPLSPCVFLETLARHWQTQVGSIGPDNARAPEQATIFFKPKGASAIQGNLQHVGLGEVMQILSIQNLTGILVLSHADQQIHFCFRGGTVQCAQANYPYSSDGTNQIVQDLTFEALSWTEGFFGFYKLNELPSGATASLNLPTKELIQEGLHRMHQWKMLQQKIKTPVRRAPSQPNRSRFLDA